MFELQLHSISCLNTMSISFCAIYCTLSPDKKDYDEYVVKVKRQNDKGEDLTGDDVGSGGRRREDGTLSAQYYDPRPYKPMEEAPPYYSDPPAPQRSALSSGQRMLVDTASNALSDIVVRLIEDVVIPAVQRRWKEKFVPGAKRFYHRIMDKNPRPLHRKSRRVKHRRSKRLSPKSLSVRFLRLCVITGRT